MNRINYNNAVRCSVYTMVILACFCSSSTSSPTSKVRRVNDVEGPKKVKILSPKPSRDVVVKDSSSSKKKVSERSLLTGFLPPPPSYGFGGYLPPYITTTTTTKPPVTNRAKYSFGYEVDDVDNEGGNEDGLGANFGQQESRDGDFTQGSYFVHLPDGRKQTVTYVVEGDKGYQAVVRYQKSNRIPTVISPSPIKNDDPPTFQETAESLSNLIENPSAIEGGNDGDIIDTSESREQPSIEVVAEDDSSEIVDDILTTVDEQVVVSTTTEIGSDATTTAEEEGSEVSEAPEKTTATFETTKVTFKNASTFIEQEETTTENEIEFEEDTDAENLQPTEGEKEPIISSTTTTSTIIEEPIKTEQDTEQDVELLVETTTTNSLPSLINEEESSTEVTLEGEETISSDPELQQLLKKLKRRRRFLQRIALNRRQQMTVDS